MKMKFRMDWIGTDNKSYREYFSKNGNRLVRSKELLDSEAINRGDCYIDREDGNGYIYQYSFFGNSEIDKMQAAATLGRLGGSVKSDAKSAAARENGKLGGRPRKEKK